jgi:hypothetical protein
MVMALDHAGRPAHPASERPSTQAGPYSLLDQLGEIGVDVAPVLKHPDGTGSLAPLET